ncbi:MAG: restriction endonuclease subunit S [Alphaproteobacteria bacterium PA4]|nr:MAG: restriction endonuclease subunit S [Alphaproteobacteria bacterium PA4]
MSSAIQKIADVSNWRTVKLGEVLTLINGRAYKKEEERDSGTPVLRIQNLNGGNRWFYSDLSLPESKYCERGDLLFAWSATFGPYIWLGEKVIYHYHIWKVECSPELDKRFAYYLLQHITESVKAAGRGISMIHMTKGGMEDWNVSIPPLAEQKRIAAILDQAEDLRRKCQRAIDRLNQLGQAIFNQMFDDSNSSIPLRDVCSLITDGTHHTPTYVEEGVVFLSAKNVTQLKIDWSNIKYVPESLHVQLKKRVSPRMNDVLLAKNGTTGVAAIVDKDVVFDIYVSLALLRAGEAILPKFLLYAVNNHKTRRQFDGSLKGVGVSNLHLVDIRRATIPKANLKDQAEFVERVEAVESQMARQGQINFRTNELFAAIQNRAFRGEL